MILRLAFFKDGSKRSVVLKKNISLSIFLKSVNIGINILIIPITINCLNSTKYGIWLTLSSIVGWLYFFDIGIGNGLRNRLSESFAASDIVLSKKYVSTGYVLITFIAIMISLIIIIVIPLINWTKLLNTSSSLSKELLTLVFAVFILFCIQLSLRLINIILLADLKTAKSDLLGVLSNALSLVFILCLKHLNRASLINIGIAFASPPILILSVASVILFAGKYRNIRPSFHDIDWSCSKDLLALGSKFIILQIGAIAVYQTTNIIIMRLFGPESVTKFNIAFKYFSIPLMIFIIFVTPLWSAFTDAYVKNEIVWMKNTLKRYKRLTQLFSILVIVMLFISPYVFRIWIGSRVQIDFSLAVSVAFYILVYLWMSMYIYIINGIGKITFQVYAAIIEIVFNIPLSILLANIFGINGVIISITLFALLRCVWAPFQINRLIDGKAVSIWNK